MPCVRYDRFSDPWLQLGGKPLLCATLQDSKTPKNSHPRIPCERNLSDFLGPKYPTPHIRHHDTDDTDDTDSLEDLRDALLDRERGCRGAV